MEIYGRSIRTTLQRAVGECKKKGTFGETNQKFAVIGGLVAEKAGTRFGGLYAGYATSGAINEAANVGSPEELAVYAVGIPAAYKIARSDTSRFLSSAAGSLEAWPVGLVAGTGAKAWEKTSEFLGGDQDEEQEEIKSDGGIDAVDHRYAEGFPR